MSKLAELLIKRHGGREDWYAIGSENGFEPVNNPINTETIDSCHLGNDVCCGFYVLSKDSKVMCACVDFDDHPHNPDPAWRDKAEQLYYYLQNSGLDPLLEISQSGTGAHVWLFMGEPVEAWVPRAFLSGLGNKLQNGYREVYPRQEQLSSPEKLGNLIRYPLWGASRYVDPDDSWKAIDPEHALEGVQTIDCPRGSLMELAAELGLGLLQPQYAHEEFAVEGGNTIKLPRRVWTMLNNERTRLGRRWAGDTEGMTDPSNSALAMAIATELVQLYLPTTVVENAIRVWGESRIPEKVARRDWIEGTVRRAYDMVGDRMHQASPDVVTLDAATDEAIRIIESGGKTYHKFDVREVDDSIDGIASGELCIMAALPGNGKTALGLQWACHAAQHGTPTLIISEEMSAVELAKRKLMSIEPEPPHGWTAEDAERLRGIAHAAFADWAPVYITQSRTIERVMEDVRRHATLYNVGAVMVDYMQLLNGTGGDGEYAGVTSISKGLKQVVRDTSVAMLALAQLNRGYVQRGGLTTFDPQPSDLRGSGQIEQDADLILFGDHLWKRLTDVDPRTYRIKCEKRRNGPIRERYVETEFNMSTQTFGRAKANNGLDGGE
jgi:hypothetical protein